MTRRTFLVAAPLFTALGLLAAVDAFYIVGQAQQAVLLRLGQPVAAVNGGPAPVSAGLHLKWPLVDQVAIMDRRTLEVLTPPGELRAATAASTSLQAEMRYRIRDPLRFYLALGDGPLGQQKLSARLQDGFERTLQSTGAEDAAGTRLALATTMLADVRRQTVGSGVDILDVRLVEAAPSPSSVEAVSRWMQDAETQQVAQIKAEGEQHRRELLAQADRDAADVRGEGERQALEVRGDGDAQRAAILGAAYGGDPGFARFFRRLEAYDQAFNPDNTTLVLSPDNAFLDLFARGPGGLGKPPG